MHYLCHTEGFATTFKSGAKHHNGLVFCLHYCGIRLTAIDRPSDYKKLFNLRHAQAQNVIEHVFGVVKRRFWIMGIGPEYNLDMQTLLISAVCVLHNFIRIHNPGDLDGADINAELERRAPRRCQKHVYKGP